MYLPVLMVHLKKNKKQRSLKDSSNDAYSVFFASSDFLNEGTCCWYLFELHRDVHAIQMGTHNICLYKEVDKKCLTVRL